MVDRMNLKQKLIYKDKEYDILSAEQEYIVHPIALNLLPLEKEVIRQPFQCNYHIENYKLYIDDITLATDEKLKHSFQNQKVSYNGAILIAEKLLKEYIFEGRIAGFSYQNVYELVFEDGILIATIDQRKAMLRIRKNIELGLRGLSEKKDLRCIRRFMNSSFVGDYRPYKTTKRLMKYLKEMKADYEA